jgi:hypothetical protein
LITRTDQDGDNLAGHEEPRNSSLRSFGARAAALAGLLVTVAVPIAGATADADTANEVDTAGEVIEAPWTPNPSTCC